MDSELPEIIRITGIIGRKPESIISEQPTSHGAWKCQTAKQNQLSHNRLSDRPTDTQTDRPARSNRLSAYTFLRRRHFKLDERPQAEANPGQVSPLSRPHLSHVSLIPSLSFAISQFEQSDDHHRILSRLSAACVTVSFFSSTSSSIFAAAFTTMEQLSPDDHDLWHRTFFKK